MSNKTAASISPDEALKAILNKAQHATEDQLIRACDSLDCVRESFCFEVNNACLLEEYRTLSDVMDCLYGEDDPFTHYVVNNCDPGDDAQRITADALLQYCGNYLDPDELQSMCCWVRETLPDDILPCWGWRKCILHALMTTYGKED